MKFQVTFNDIFGQSNEWKMNNVLEWKKDMNLEYKLLVAR